MIMQVDANYKPYYVNQESKDNKKHIYIYIYIVSNKI